MPSIVLFGKIFCRYFSRPKFLRDFVGFRPAKTHLLYSILNTSCALAREPPPSTRVFCAPVVALIACAGRLLGAEVLETALHAPPAASRDGVEPSRRGRYDELMTNLAAFRALDSRSETGGALAWVSSGRRHRVLKRELKAALESPPH